VNDLRNRSAREVFEDHLRTAKEWAFEEDIKRNFSEDCVVLIRDGVYWAHDSLIELANRLREEMPAATFEYTTQRMEGDAAFLEWMTRFESVKVTDGADSFFIRDGLVVAQTIHYTVEQLR